MGETYYTTLTVFGDNCNSGFTGNIITPLIIIACGDIAARTTVCIV